jgi:hypothetical protein
MSRLRGTQGVKIDDLNAVEALSASEPHAAPNGGVVHVCVGG